MDRTSELGPLTRQPEDYDELDNNSGVFVHAARLVDAQRAPQMGHSRPPNILTCALVSPEERKGGQVNERERRKARRVAAKQYINCILILAPLAACGDYMKWAQACNSIV